MDIKHKAWQWSGGVSGISCTELKPMPRSVLQHLHSLLPETHPELLGNIELKGPSTLAVVAPCLQHLQQYNQQHTGLRFPFCVRYLSNCFPWKKQMRRFPHMSHYRTLFHYQEIYHKISKRCGSIRSDPLHPIWLTSAYRIPIGLQLHLHLNQTK